MQPLFSLLLAITFLVGQLGLVAHVYEEHDDEQLCEICITLKQQDHALASTAPTLQLQSSYELQTEKQPQGVLTFNIRPFSVRAPPIFL